MKKAICQLEFTEARLTHTSPCGPAMSRRRFASPLAWDFSRGSAEPSASEARYDRSCNPNRIPRRFGL